MDTHLTALPGAADLVQADRARSTLYTDPAIFETEMSRVFESTWVWVAHASEIADASLVDANRPFAQRPSA